MGLADPLENAHRELPKLAREWFTAGRAAVKPGASWVQMHRFRLATKHFRYTMELFRPLYGEALEAYLERLREVQTLLGEINDCQTAKELVVSEARPDTRPFARYLNRQLVLRSKAFRTLWQERLDVAAEARTWQRLLAGR